MSTSLEPSRLSPSDQGALRSLLDAVQGSPLPAAPLPQPQTPSLPEPALWLAAELVEHLATGRSVTVLSGEEEISPRKAAGVGFTCAFRRTMVGLPNREQPSFAQASGLRLANLTAD
jgi:hypothetical protein